jgi:NADPH:quinone reductase-like Zn-dependent oxidoreductase
MKAVVYNRYGSPDVLQLKQVEKPTPRDNEVLIRINATTVTAGDWRMRKADPFAARLYNGLFRPLKVTILGFELAGDVEAVGKNVTRFKQGDSVFGSCGIRFGAYAEYKCLTETGILALKPSNMTYQEAAAVADGATTALFFLRDKGNIQRGQKVLIYGASGGIGTAAVQLAKYFGAEVTGVCSTGKLELVRSLGADHVIDYTQADFADAPHRYDLILDIAGNPTLARLRRALTPTGTAVIVGGESKGNLTGGIDRQLRAVILSAFIGQRLTGFVCKENAADLEMISEFMAAGTVIPSIERTYQLDQVPNAMRHLSAGKVRGKVAISV